MNFFKQLFAISLIALYAIMVSCGNKDNNPSPADQFIRKMTVGNWKITEFKDSGNIATANYNGYFFMFNPDGSIMASNGLNAFSGSWNLITNPSDGDDDKLDELDLEIKFNQENEFDNLTLVWDILYENQNRFDLGIENDSNESLRFEKL
ncbi:hypothetical protein [Marinigracilibium pacificum]|uniref:Lipocalin-like protein n=1 Tax=Marinigracilibium pacificum TaxID=2729599 RepID=A0A848ITC3_9BACT|nr:hypothetical protein [Marinigracilibium pacificum]NMM47597.1 hypothetical protein [Marinigracilibium pacificum]